MQRAASLEKPLILGKTEGKRRRAWQRMRWLDSINNSMDMNLSKLQEIVEDRGAWHKAIHRITELDKTKQLNNVSLCSAQLLSCVWLFVTPWTVACQASLSMRILQASILEWVAMSSSMGFSQPRDRTQVSPIAGRFFTIWAIREAKNTGVGSLCLLLGVCLTQESNWVLLHRRWILYQGSPLF